MRTFCLLLLFWATHCHAQQGTNGPMRFTTFWPCNGNASFCAPRILAEGTIQNDTANQFLRFLGNTKSHAHQLPPKPTVVFNSPGGSVFGGMALGQLIRQRNMDTEMDVSYSRAISLAEDEVFVKNATCASACVLAFAGGHTRTIQTKSSVGIHQFSTPGGNIGDSATQVTIVALAAYLEKMGIHRSLLDVASLVPHTSIKWLTGQEAKAFTLDNSSTPLSPWRIAATPQGLPVLELTQMIGPGRNLYLRVAQFNSYFTLAITLDLNKTIHSPDRILFFPSLEIPEIKLCGDAYCTKGYASKSWVRSESRDRVRFQGVVAFASEDFLKFAGGDTLLISDALPPALSDIGISTNLSKDGLANGIALLRRTPN